MPAEPARSSTAGPTLNGGGGVSIGVTEGIFPTKEEGSDEASSAEGAC